LVEIEGDRNGNIRPVSGYAFPGPIWARCLAASDLAASTIAAWSIWGTTVLLWKGRLDLPSEHREKLLLKLDPQRLVGLDVVRLEQTGFPVV